jgi:hypothetical protein
MNIRKWMAKKPIELKIWKKEKGKIKKEKKII